MKRKSDAIVGALLILTLPLCGISAFAAESAATGLIDADALYQSGQFSAALDRYRVLATNGALPLAVRAGMIRCHLKLQRIDDAHTAALQAVSAEPQSSLAHALLGLVLFRRGEMSPAEDSYRNALNLNPDEPDALIGLADLYWAFSMRGKAYKLIVSAHKVAPDHPEVQKSWMAILRRKPRIQALEAYLSSPKPDDEYTTSSLHRTLEFMKASAGQSAHACRAVSGDERTEIQLEAMRWDPKRIWGFGLKVKFNDKTSTRMLVDTGAGGLLLGSKVAEKAGVVRIADSQMYGIGDEGSVAGYTGYVEKIRIGNLEFRDCLVRVSDKKTLVGLEGIIGTDVFSRYLVDLDMPAEVLRLGPLPKPPDGNDDELEDDEEGDGATQQKYPELIRPPRDRYLAPEMQDWSKVFRFGHLLMMFTRTQEGKRLVLFLIDTGASHNILSTSFGREITKVNKDYAPIRGISGKVKQVYTADKADLVFGGLLQKNQDVTTLDLSNLSARQGVEFGGILGFPTLHLLDIKINYRDGLVKFSYDPNRLPRRSNW